MSQTAVLSFSGLSALHRKQALEFGCIELLQRLKSDMDYGGMEHYLQLDSAAWYSWPPDTFSQAVQSANRYSWPPGTFSQAVQSANRYRRTVGHQNEFQ
uniref:Uncharacterized protein n=1 Tax=Romanomermis culicivorax TaxID=13658 RepID=A0A915KIG3_ROMCU